MEEQEGKKIMRKAIRERRRLRRWFHRCATRERRVGIPEKVVAIGSLRLGFDVLCVLTL